MQANFSQRLKKLLLLTPLAVAAIYLLLLIPERNPGLSQGAGQESFAWKQDRFWTELEKEFVTDRAQGCGALANRINTSLRDANLQLNEIAAKPLLPDDPKFAVLETNLFRLAPLIAACPERSGNYLSLISRARSVVKKQSEHWDMEIPETRHRIYRLLYGGRIALEEAMLQAPTNAVAALGPGEEEPSSTPAVAIQGVKLHSGDILLSRGGAPTSALIARGNDFPGNFSHVALLHVDEKTGQASLIESHIERGVAVASFDEYLQDKKLRILVLRLRSDLPALRADPLLPHKAASAALTEARDRHVPYDFTMDYHDHRAQFCSEVAAAAYEKVGVRLWMKLSSISSPTVTAWLGSLGARHFETQEPSDLEYDPQLRVVAEWRDPATLFKAHVDDAVTDVMLEKARPGRGLDYNPWMLPVARISKAWSVLLNAVGKVGPIPEGMTAATALRVSRYQAEHSALANRVLTLAEEFRKSHGYTPPYWELIKLARQGM